MNIPLQPPNNGDSNFFFVPQVVVPFGGVPMLPQNLVERFSQRYPASFHIHVHISHSNPEMEVSGVDIMSVNVRL